MKSTLSAILLTSLVLSSLTYAGVVPVQNPLYKGKDQKDDLLLFVGKGSDGGRLAIDNHAEFMVARDTNNVVRNWNNAGTFKWSFGRYGYDGPLSEYPLFEADVDGSPAVTFDGNDKLRMITASSTPLPSTITDGILSIELWLKDPMVEPEEVILRFEDGDKNLNITASQFGLKGSDEWQYLVLISDGKNTSFYKNKKKVNVINSPLAFSEKTIINLGAGSFSGSIAAVRIHTETMEPEDMDHNYKGGVILGTHLFYAINAKKLDDMMVGDPTRESDDLEVRESEHFVSMWIPSGNPKPEDDIAKRVEEHQLPDSEVAYDWMSHTLALHMPLVSDKEELRGDGRKYKIHHGNKWQGGDFMGFDGDIQFGWGCSYAGYFNDHELTHGVDAHQMGAIEGHWWESHANWCPSYAGFPHVNPANLCSQHAHVYPSTGGNYYHAYLIWDHLAEDPEFGPLFPTRLWNYNPTPDTRVFPPLAMKEMDPDPSTPFDDEWVEMAAKNITWDYKRHPEYKKDYKADPRLHWILLEQVPHMEPGWYEPPKWRAPQQHGYNLCPLDVNPGNVSAELTGYIDAKRGSDWRAMFVAVQKGGSPRYGKIFTTDKPGSFEVRNDDKDLFLVVVATPTNIIKMGIFGNDPDADYRKPGKDRFPYLVKLSGTTPRADLFRPTPGIQGNVAPTAYVAPTAHIGPNAQVLDNARVEDYATVDGIVRGNARITGYAEVTGKAVVEDNARVSDFAQVNSHIYGDARVMEHATVNGETYDFAVIKGNAISSGPVHGNGIVDGNYIKGNDVDKGYWFNWSWGTGQADGEVDEDFKSLYCQYDFDKHNGYRIWDTHGITWARTVNGPKHTNDNERSILALDGKDTFVVLHDSIANKDTCSLELTVKWAGGKAGQKLLSFSNTETGDAVWLTPKDANGKLRFTIKVGDTVNTIAAKSVLPKGKWSTIQIITFDDKILLFVNDQKAAADKNFTLDLEDVKANACYIGRGPDGNYFNGAIDSFTVWSKALIEDVPPSPNPSEFIITPLALDDHSCMMQAVMASDANGPVEYYFEETTGNPGGSSSEWQLSPVFMATGLKADTTYAYRVRTRDKSNNITDYSKPVEYKNTGASEHFIPDEKGVLCIEAENFDTSTKGTLFNNAWEITDKPEGFSGNGVVTVADRGKQIGDKFATDKSPRLDYTVKFDKPGKYFMYLRGTGNPSGDSCHGGLNMQETEGLKAIGNNQLNGREFKWSNGSEFTVPQAGVYKLNLWMREDGAVIDKIVIMKNRKKLEGQGPAESRKE